METMKIKIKDQEYNLIIDKKRSTKNTYIRVRDNLDIYATCNTFTSNKVIFKLIEDNIESIDKMLSKVKKKMDKKDEFLYLGKHYDIVYLNKNGITFGEEKVFINPNFDLDKWYKKEALRVFKMELDKIYHEFVYDIPYPSLCIRKMKTRWGVCNVKTHKVTLNLELIKKDIIYLDYVIVHELSHLIHANHSKAFWQCVEDNFKDYKKVRKELKNDA